jgi:uncharacterized protein YcbX
MTMHLQQIHRYPLKSALGETLQSVEVSPGGVAGDRVFALLDRVTGRVVSAKRPKLWRSMLQLSAATLPGGSEIAVRFPDGHILHSNEEGLAPALEGFLGHDIEILRRREGDLQLERSRPEDVVAQGLDADVTMDVNSIGEEAPGGAFQDLAAVHLMTAATAHAIAAAAGLSGPEISRYRPNFVIDGGDSAAFAENGWIGRELRIGSLRLEITHPTPRCAIPVLEQGSGCAFQPAVLAAINQLNRRDAGAFGVQPCAGAYARVIAPGVVKSGDFASLV